MVRLNARTVVLLSLPPAFWAGNAVAGRLLVGDVPPIALSFLRWLLALLLFLPFAWQGLAEHRETLRRHWRAVVVFGIVGVGCYNTFQYLALQTSTAVNVTLIASSTPVFTLALGALVFSERTHRAQWSGSAISLLGVLWVLCRGEPAQFLQIEFVPGDLIMLAANLTWAVYTWLLRKRRPELPFAPFLAAQMAVGVLAIAPFAVLESSVSERSIVWSASTWMGLAYVATFPSLIAYACWDLGVARAGALLPMYFLNLTPVFAALLSTLVLAEAPQLYHLVGLLLIVAGIHLASRTARTR